MRKDYHMHPTVVQAPERLEAFIDNALAHGIQEICVTDHMPLVGVRASDRIPDGRVGEYCDTVRRLAKQYEDRISVKLGIEVDYHPTAHDQIEAVLQAGQYDHILGSSHLHAFQNLNLFSGTVTYNEYAAAMFENTLAAIRTGWFTAIPHLDMHRWIFSLPQRFPLVDDGYDEAYHWDRIQEILELIRDTGMMLEINPHFASRDFSMEKIYPRLPILERALDLGIRFCYGSDAHKPEEVATLLDQLRDHPVYGRAIAQWERD